MNNKVPDSCDECSYALTSYGNADFKCGHEDGRLVKIMNPFSRNLACPLLDEILTGKRYKVKYREHNFYFMVMVKKNVPYEIFIECSVRSDPSFDYMLSAWDAFTRVTTLALKAYPLAKVIRQIKKSSRRKSDLPGITTKILEDWL